MYFMYCGTFFKERGSPATIRKDHAARGPCWGHFFTQQRSGACICCRGARRPGALMLDAAAKGRKSGAISETLPEGYYVCKDRFSAESVATSLGKTWSRRRRGAAKCGERGIFPGFAPMPIPSFDLITALSRTGSLRPGMCRRLCRGVPHYSGRNPACFDRERESGIHDGAIVDGIRTYAADSLAEWLRSSDCRSSGPMFAEGGALPYLPQRKGPFCLRKAAQDVGNCQRMGRPSKPGMLARKRRRALRFHFQLMEKYAEAFTGSSCMVFRAPPESSADA